MLKLTVLLDNNTFIDRYYLGEPGVSYFIETGGDDGRSPVRILFDTGYSDAFLRNAGKMGIDLRKIDHLVLSHGHSDHTWGLDPLIKLLSESGKGKNGGSRNKPLLWAHPAAFLPKREKSAGHIGPIVSPEILQSRFNLSFSSEPVWITEELLFLGEIERKSSFENRNPIGQIPADPTEPGEDPENWVDDYVADDTAVAYRGPEGLTVITGCSHAGICNIVDQAIRPTGETRIADIVGGFHLLDPGREQLGGTVEYLRRRAPKKLHACHCVDLRSKIALAAAAPLEETGSGLVLKYR